MVYQLIAFNNCCKADSRLLSTCWAQKQEQTRRKSSSGIRRAPGPIIFLFHLKARCFWSVSSDFGLFPLACFPPWASSTLCKQLQSLRFTTLPKCFAIFQNIACHFLCLWPIWVTLDFLEILCALLFLFSAGLNCNRSIEQVDGNSCWQFTMHIEQSWLIWSFHVEIWSPTYLPPTYQSYYYKVTWLVVMKDTSMPMNQPSLLILALLPLAVEFGARILVVW
jgi:hypothetical protein